MPARPTADCWARSAPGSFQNRASDAPGNGEPAALTRDIDNGRRHVAQTHHFCGDPAAHRSAGRTDQEWNVQLGVIQTRAVREITGVLAEALAVVGDNEEPCPFTQPASIERIEQNAELLVEISDAIVIGIDGKRHARGRDRFFVEQPPLPDQEPLVWVGRLGSESV